jgi:hypothetical protein
MTSTTLEIQLPAPLLRLGISREEISHRVAEWLVFSLFVEGRISSGPSYLSLLIRPAVNGLG